MTKEDKVLLEIAMPRLSDQAEEGLLVTWFVVSGGAVREGDLVAEVQVEKMSEEVRSPGSGVIRQLVEAGEVVAQGAPIAELEIVEEPARVTGEVEQAPTSADGLPSSASAPGGIPLASPAARRLARDLGVDLAGVQGSGPTGRIVEADVRAAGGSGGIPLTSTEPAPELVEAEPLTPMRRAIAQHLIKGLATTAQLTLTAEGDVSDLHDLRERMSSQGQTKVSYTEAVVRAVALTLQKHPRVGAQWSDAGLVRPPGINIGIAVALENGLVVPVIRNADHKDLEMLNREIAELSERARASKLKQEEMDGGILTVTNLGAQRIDVFTPLLNIPETAILGVGQVRLRPAVVGNEVVPRWLVVLSLTFDHQVIDGVPAAAFLADVIRLLEHPRDLL